MDLYFGEYSLSDDTIMKLETNKELLSKLNEQIPETAWCTLFKIENDEQKEIIGNETDVSMEIEEVIPSQNSVREDHQASSMAFSQFVATQVEEKKKIPSIIPQFVHHQQRSELELINIAEFICDILENSNGTLSPDNLKNLRSSDVEEIIERLSQQLSLNGIQNLCNYLCCWEIDTAIQYVKPVCSKILLQRIVKLEKLDEAVKIISIIIRKLAEKFPEDIYKWIFIPLINTDIEDTSIIMTIINIFMRDRKMTVISDFLMTMTELKTWHLIILISIIDINIDNNMKDRLLTLLMERVTVLSNDPDYSKFILSFMKSNSPFSESQKMMLDEIATVNDTRYKLVMKKILQNM